MYTSKHLFVNKHSHLVLKMNMVVGFWNTFFWVTMFWDTMFWDTLFWDTFFWDPAFIIFFGDPTVIIVDNSDINDNYDNY